MTDQPDTIRAAIISRAESLGLTAYAVSIQCRESNPDTPTADPGTVKRYFNGRISLNSRYVSQICDVLGLELTIKKQKLTVRQRAK